MPVIFWPAPGAGTSTTTAPASPWLSISDAKDGTGGTATVSNASDGSTNTLYSQKFDQLGSPQWVSEGARSGDGTISLTGHALGQFFWKIESTTAGGGATSNIVYQPLTDECVAAPNKEYNIQRGRWRTLRGRFCTSFTSKDSYRTITVDGTVRRPLEYREVQYAMQFAPNATTTIFLLPDENMQSLEPTNGDTVTDKSGNVWSVLKVDRELDDTFWRLLCVKNV